MRSEKLLKQREAEVKREIRDRVTRQKRGKYGLFGFGETGITGILGGA